MGGSEEDSTAQRANTAEEAASTKAPHAGMKRVACDEEQGGAAGVKQARTEAEATEQAGAAAGAARTAQPSSAPEPAPAPAATHNNTDNTNSQTEAPAAATTTTQATAAATEVTTTPAAEPAGTAGNDAATPQVHPPVERSASPSAQPPAGALPGPGTATTAAAAAATAAGATAASSAATGTASALAAAYSEDKGCRTVMEDVCVLQLDARPPGGPECRLAFFGVFDGHGGVACATAASQQLHSRVLEAGLLGKGLLAGGKTDAKACKAAVAEGFKTTDAALLKECASKGWQDGACAVAVWVLQELVLVANVGDAKCILARLPEQAASSAADAQAPKPKAIVLTKEHTALIERQRIEKAGGTVVNGRLAGRIQISRSFGDAAFKRLGCSAAPDVTAFPLTRRDRFMLLGCDGFWGVFGAQEAVDAAAALLAEGAAPKAVTNRLLYVAVREKKCKDNCSVLLVQFA